MYVKLEDMEKLNIAIQYAHNKLNNDKIWQDIYLRAVGAIAKNAELRARTNEKVKRVVRERRKFDKAYGRGNIQYKKDNAVIL